MTLGTGSDARLDPRLRAFLAAVTTPALPDVENREQLLAEANSAEAIAMRETIRAFMDLCDEAVPSDGLEISTRQFVSEPDGNSDQPAGHPARARRGPALRVLHPRGRHGIDVLLRRDVSRLGEAHRRQRGRRRHGRLPQLPDPFVGARGGALPRRSQRLRVGPALDGDPRRRTGDRSGTDRRRRRERRGEPHLGHRPQAQARRGSRPDQGSLRALPLHRRAMAGPGVPLLRGERGHPLEPPQQPRCDGLRDRGIQRAEPAGLAVLRRAWTTSPASLRR